MVVAIVPAWRKWAWGKIEKPVSQIGQALKIVRDPKTAVMALGSALGTEILYGAGLAMCVLAVGGSVSLGEAIFINVTVSLFAGLMPVPGGVGVGEAGMTAGLTAVGVPSEIAVSAVIVYRLDQLLLASNLGLRLAPLARSPRLPLTVRSAPPGAPLTPARRWRFPRRLKRRRVLPALGRGAARPRRASGQRGRGGSPSVHGGGSDGNDGCDVSGR